MNAELLLQHFKRLSEAPDAIPRLRRFFLDLAVRGKLVEQDPNDEPAAELFKRIQVEKARLMKDGKLRKQKQLRAVGKDEVPSISPSNWKWERLGTLSTMITKGSTPTSYGHAFTQTGINFIKVESIKKGLLLSKNVTSFISEETHNFLARSQLEIGDILFSIAGSIGTCAVVTNDVLPANTNQALAIIRGTQLVYNPAFILICIQSSVVHVILNKARGGAMNNVSLDDIQNFVTPLPPLAEQNRIVAKVEELMALCDQLEAARTEREQSRDRLLAANLHNLNQLADDEEAFREHVRFTFNHLKRITTRTTHIKQLRQTILDLAVRGKLVPQDSNDEPAAELLKRNSVWRTDAIKLKQIREPRKTLKNIGYDETPYTIPSGWAWARLGEIIYIQSGDGLTAANMKNGDVPVFGGNGINGYHDKSNVEEPTIVIGRVGYYCGSIHVTPNKAWVTDNAFITRFCQQAISMSFLVLLLNGTNLKENENATAQPVISGSKIYPIVIGLPPLAEQSRIIAKFDQLMALCDQLEAQLTTTEADSRSLLEAVLHEALAPALEEAA